MKRSYLLLLPGIVTALLITVVVVAFATAAARQIEAAATVVPAGDFFVPVGYLQPGHHCHARRR